MESKPKAELSAFLLLCNIKVIRRSAKNISVIAELGKPQYEFFLNKRSHSATIITVILNMVIKQI